MSNQKKSDEEEEFLAEFYKSLSEGGVEYEEEDFGFYPAPNSTGFNSDYGFDFDFEEPPEIPKEIRCKHKRVEKKYLITTHYFVCKDCGKEVDEK